MYSIPSIDKIKLFSKRKLFDCVSTFAGGGGSCTGIKWAGGNVRYYNDFVEKARETYEANYFDADTVFDGRDIREITGEQILQLSGIRKGQLHLLQGSPPCQAFSEGGTRGSRAGEEVSYSGKKQVVDDLFFEFARIVDETQPMVFIAENVEGLTKGKAKELLGEISEFSLSWGEEQDKTILGTLSALGYKLCYGVLNCADYGIPQTRKRLFIVGVRQDLGITPTLPEPTHVGNHITIREAFINLVNDSEEEEELLGHTNHYSWGKVLKMLPKNDPKPQFANRIMGGGSFMSMKRLAQDLPSPTIAQRSQRGANAGICHYEEDRKLTTNEIKRIMSFPDDYILTGKTDDKLERLGRSVPPLMMKILSEHMYNTILSKVI